MRYIQVPADVVIAPSFEVRRQIEAARAAGQTIAEPPSDVMSFKRYALMMWMDDARAIKSGETYSLVKQRRWYKVLDAFESAKPGDEMALDDEDWGTLRGIVDAPNNSLQPSIARQMLCFSDAVLDASDKPRTTAP